MLDVFTEDLLSLAQIVKMLPPGRQGKPVNFSTVYRWIFDGISSPSGGRIKLEAIRLGGRYLVSRQSLQRFIEQLSSRIDATATPARTPAARSRASKAARKKLEEIGV